jgi:adenylyl- and sulfurtransferase ThiI
LNVILVFPSASASRQALARTIRESGCKVSSEGECIVCEGRDHAKLASKLTNLAGVGTIAIARKVTSRFSDITNAIVQAGSKAILPNEKFYVKVIQMAKADYVDRDIEFASAGALVDKLAEINVLPARNEQEADRVVLAIVGKKSAYICVKAS